jgi:hypothetical protein
LKLYLSQKSLLTPAYRTGRSLCQREELVPPLWKRGARGDFLNVNPVSILLINPASIHFWLSDRGDILSDRVYISKAYLAS